MERESREKKVPVRIEKVKKEKVGTEKVGKRKVGKNRQFKHADLADWRQFGTHRLNWKS